MNSPTHAPALVATLRTALVARAPRVDPSHLSPFLFVESVVGCDAADRRYRDAIRSELAPDAARDLLAASDAFRADVFALRVATGTQIDALLRRGGLAAVAIDAFDLATPRLSGLTHVDLVRLADLGDRARRDFDGARARANDLIAPLLDPQSREALVNARKTRICAFSDAIGQPLTDLRAEIERFPVTVEALAMLADRWY